MDRAEQFIEKAWAAAPDAPGTIIQTLIDYIAIPNLSPAFEPDWDASGHTDAAVALFVERIRQCIDEWSRDGCSLSDVSIDVLGGKDNPVRNSNGKRRTPLLRVEIPAHGDNAPAGTILLYGHLDKQPPGEGSWSPGLHPYKAVITNDRLYGRGGADDGYALWCALSAVAATRAAGKSHARSVIIIEAAEESGADDLDLYVEAMKEYLGDVRLVVCLDSGCGDFDNLWTTDSLRGVINGTLSIGVLREGVHSGDSSGVVPSPIRLLRLLLSRLEKPETGGIIPGELRVPIPPHVEEKLQRTAKHLGDGVMRAFPFLEGVQAVEGSPLELLLNRGWRSGLVVKGLDGVPPTAGSGNVMLPYVNASLSMRIPPTLPAGPTSSFIKNELQRTPPGNAQVAYTVDSASNGWAAPRFEEWLETALVESARDYYGGELYSNAEGGSIPFMSFLGGLFPTAQFLVTGVLGPGANAHGPDESLYIPAAVRLAKTIARVLSNEQ